MENNRTLPRRTLISFLKSSGFGTILLVCSTILEGFYAFKVFNITGIFTFTGLTFLVSIIYATLVTGVIVFFALRNNKNIVIIAIIYELSLNILLDVLTILLTRHEYWFGMFIGQAVIGGILPLATKAFADELNKKIVRGKYKKAVPRPLKSPKK